MILFAIATKDFEYMEDIIKNKKEHHIKNEEESKALLQGESVKIAGKNISTGI